MRFRLLLVALLTIGVRSQEQKKDAAQGSVAAFRPEVKKFTEQSLQQLKAPPGFEVNVFAKELGNARMMQVAEDGTVFLTCFKENALYALPDKNNDGVADESKQLLTINGLHGITLHDGWMYLASVKEIYRAKMQNGLPGKPELLVKDLPDGGQHPKRTIGVGPDKMLYISVGSTCNNCQEPNPENAAMLRSNLDGSNRAIFASGLRNTIGFAWHPQTRELWGMDHGSDFLGNDAPPEELNKIVQSGDYGWPFCYGNKNIDPFANPPKEGTKEEHCSRSLAPALEYQAHSAPIGFVFYTGSQYPAEYKGSAFAAMRGSWNRQPATGYKVVRIKFDGGQPKEFEDFLTGFLAQDGQSTFGRPAGLAVAKDGSLLLAEDSNGIIYRISYVGGQSGK